MEDVLSLIPRVPNSRNYWFVRTHGGYFYESNIANSSIGISLNKITLKDTELDETELEEKIKLHYPKYLTPSHTAKQIKRFAKEIKKGDIVLIPSKGSEEIYFGEVIDDGIFVDEDDHGIKLWQQKRRKISWIKRKKRDELNSQLYKLIYSRHTISSGAHYAQQIDQVLNDFYIKGDSAYLILDVQTKKGIIAKQFFGLGSSIMEVFADFNNHYNLGLDDENLTVTVDLHSPGKITFTGNMKAIAAVGLLLVGIAGGGFYYQNIKLGTDGLIKSLIDYQNSQHERQMKEQAIQKYMDKLEVKTAEDLAKVMNAITYKKESP